jgi:cellulose biosynthesis protein BcsQ
MKTIAIFSIKGGVGKTAIAVNLAHVLATRSARRTLLWDLDAQGAATDMLRVDSGKAVRKLFGDKHGTLDAHIEPTAWDGLDVLPADMSLRKLDVQLAEVDRAKQLARLLSGIARRYARIVLDCPPGLGLLAEQVFRAADLVVEPMTPSPLSTRAHEQLTHHLARHYKGRPPVLPVLTMVDRRRLLHREAADGMALSIPYASAIERMAVDQLPLTAAGGGPAARAFVDVAAAVERRLLGLDVNR